MRTTYRTHTCGDLRAEHAGTEVTLCGWVHARRDQGGVLFLDLRDRYGLTQVTFRGDRDAALLAAAERVRPEWVVRATGLVAARPSEAVNPDRATGEIEVEAHALVVLSEAATPPIPVDEHAAVSTELRLRHRYMDLRRPALTHTVGARARIAGTVRRHLEAQGFLDIETPTLIRSTPEGARDYLVPSRVRPGTCYALPQSPQLFKQLLMVAGQDRYYQLARCYRDEDLRADRQPEFTQVDLEASFVTEEDIFALLEPLVRDLVRTWRGTQLPDPLPRMTYAEAMERFGSDKPDLRNPLELVDLAGVAGALGFAPFTSTLESGGRVKGLRVPGGSALSRKDLDGLEREARSMGAPGLAWTKLAEGKPSGPLARFLGGEGAAAFLAAAGLEDGDLLLTAAGDDTLVHRVLGGLRLLVGAKLGLVDESRNEVLWVTDFPLFAWDEEHQRIDAQHHPFTSPASDQLEAFFAAAKGSAEDRKALCGTLRSRAYDLVMNGVEIGGGSIRIHRQDVQQTVFALLGISESEVERRFGWFVEALRYGTPPHGGIALGLDRLVMCLIGASTIQDVIAFPKTSSAADLLCGAPASVDDAQMHELHLAWDLPQEDAPTSAD